MTATVAPTTVWEAPGPGSWQRDTAHQERPFCRLWMEAAVPAFRNGFGQACARYGLPLGGFEIANVNGWFYGTFMPLAEDDFPARAAVAEAALAERPWRAVADEWSARVRDDFLRRAGELQRVDPASLGGTALAEHLEAALRLAGDGAARHFLQSGAHWMGVGLLLNEASAVTGWSHADIVRALAGSSPASVATVEALREIADAIAAEPRAAAILAGGGDAEAALATLRECSPTIGAAIGRYLDEFGWQVFTGFDFTHQAVIESPELLLATVRGAVAGRGADSSGLVRLRAAVPEGDRDRFEALLDDAALCYGIRDADSGPTLHRPFGLVRRAVLETGRRLAHRGAVHDADDAFDAEVEELRALLTGGDPAPDADELRARAARRKPPFADPPLLIGEEEAPPEGALPPAMEVLANALFAAFALEEGDVVVEARETGVLQGVGASAGVYEGRARLIRGSEDFELLEAGDILVAPMTTPAYNVVLPLLGAVVTDSGGVLSHPAIVAREYGIPAVVGTRSATTEIPDGARLRVNGTEGTVAVLG